MTLISERHTVEDVSYEWQFQRKDDPYFKGRFNGGYAFHVDQKGEFLTELHRKNYEELVNNKELLEEYIDLGIQEVRRTYTEPAVGKCTCGSHVVLDGNYLGASECYQCGKWYSMNGEEFVHPSEWELDDYEDESGFDEYL